MTPSPGTRARWLPASRPYADNPDYMITLGEKYQAAHLLYLTTLSNPDDFTQEERITAKLNRDNIYDKYNKYHKILLTLPKYCPVCLIPILAKGDQMVCIKCQIAYLEKPGDFDE